VGALPAQDKSIGLDGSIWTLWFPEDNETVEFWSPGSSTDKRNIGSFYELGVYLWGIAGLEGELY
jgi:hypothetical protein